MKISKKSQIEKCYKTIKTIFLIFYDIFLNLYLFLVIY